MDFYEYARDKAINIALKYLNKGGITKSLIREKNKNFAGLMLNDFFDLYTDSIHGLCVNTIAIPTKFWIPLIEEISRNYPSGLDGFLEDNAIKIPEEKEIAVGYWAWDIGNNPRCLLIQDSFWDEVYSKLPEGRMRGYDVSAPITLRAPRKKSVSKRCPIHVNVRKMF